jgi:hypothetical protein
MWNLKCPFDLSRAPLLRVGLLRRPTPALAVDMHHIVSDGTTRQILTQDFMALYAAGEAGTRPLRLQYRDFSTWQNALLASGKIKKQEKYWVNLYAV